MTGSTHANHRCRRDLSGTAPSRGPERVQRGASPPPLPQRGPPAGTMSPVLGPLPRASRSHSVKRPRRGGRHHGDGKADQSTESNRTGRGAAHHAGPRGTAERHAAGHNQGTGQVLSNNGCWVPQTRRAHTTRNEPRHKNRCRPTPGAVRIDECAPGGYSAPAGNEPPPSGWTSARRAAYPAPASYKTGAVRMDECAPGRYSAPVGYEQPPSGWTKVRPAATPRTRNTTHATNSTTHRGSILVNKSQGAGDTVHATQHTKGAHR